MVLVTLAGCGRTGLDGAYGDGSAEGGAFDDLDPFGDGAGGRDLKPQTCEQVDFLFVIDNSGSMADEQAKLVANYHTFVDGIRETIERLETVHVGVVTTDAYSASPGECRSVGGLVTRTAGANSSQETCGPYAEGHNYMTDADDLTEAFACAARVGTSGSGTEGILSAPVAAIAPPLTDPGQCNDGFLRDDALLVVFVITDEDAEIDPVFASADIIARKPGGRSDVVTVVLANPSDGECGLGGHDIGAWGLETFVDVFKYGLFEALCAQDFADVMDAAVAAVAEACPGAAD